MASQIRDTRYNQTWQCVVAADGAGVTVQDVAKCLGVKVTPYLRQILDEMVGFKWVEKKQEMIQTGRGLRMGWKFYPVVGVQNGS